MKALDSFYDKYDEPIKGCMLAIQYIVLEFDKNITQEFKWGMPFYYYKGKMLCYVWIDKKAGEPYLSFAEGSLMQHPLLEKGDRKRFQIFRLNSSEDLPLETIQKLLTEALSFHK